jgi:hypothetical protein
MVASLDLHCLEPWQLVVEQGHAGQGGAAVFGAAAGCPFDLPGGPSDAWLAPLAPTRRMPLGITPAGDQALAPGADYTASSSTPSDCAAAWRARSRLARGRLRRMASSR